MKIETTITNEQIAEIINNISYTDAMEISDNLNKVGISDSMVSLILSLLSYQYNNDNESSFTRLARISLGYDENSNTYDSENNSFTEENIDNTVEDNSEKTNSISIDLTRFKNPEVYAVNTKFHVYHNFYAEVGDYIVIDNGFFYVISNNNETKLVTEYSNAFQLGFEIFKERCCTYCLKRENDTTPCNNSIENFELIGFNHPYLFKVTSSTSISSVYLEQDTKIIIDTRGRFNSVCGVFVFRKNNTNVININECDPIVVCSVNAVITRCLIGENIEYMGEYNLCEFIEPEMYTVKKPFTFDSTQLEFDIGNNYMKFDIGDKLIIDSKNNRCCIINHFNKNIGYRKKIFDDDYDFYKIARKDCSSLYLFNFDIDSYIDSLKSDGFIETSRYRQCNDN